MKRILAALIFIALFFVGCSLKNEKVPDEPFQGGLMEIHFIDVGQGDSIFIRTKNSNMLIDAGTKEGGEIVCEYLSKIGVTSIDNFVGTHPHDDHLGGAVKVLREFNVERMYMTDRISTSYFFENLIEEIENKNIEVNLPEIGCQYKEKDFSFKFLSPIEDYENTNDYSIITRIEFGKTSAIFMADAENAVEYDLLESGVELKSDVLKVAHHGSKYASTYEFLDKVSPDIAVVQSGKGNSYGHPHKEALTRIENTGTKILRCDELGNIVLKSDGEKFTYDGKEIEKEEKKDKKDKEGIIIGNRRSKKYHSKECGGLPNENNSVFFTSCEEAEKEGYVPCKNCNP